jgi:hypothetical protein
MSARIKPHKVRGRQLEEMREKGPDGRIVVHHRTVDTLGRMLRSGTISEEMHDAARDFQAAFIVAQLDPLRAIPILRVPGSGREPELGLRQLHARRRVHAAMEALGGISSPAGSCVWHVVGLQRSVREWALRQGWGGRLVRHEQAQGILVAALGVLAHRESAGAVHYMTHAGTQIAIVIPARSGGRVWTLEPGCTVSGLSGTQSSSPPMRSGRTFCPT